MEKIKQYKQKMVLLASKQELLVQMAKKEFTSQYVGSYLGVLWSLINPLVMILIYWFVFTIGFKTMPIGDVPFVLWLVAGIVPWFYFSETLGGNTASILQNSYLVKKVIFPVSLLPVVRMLSNLGVHALFVGIAITLLAWQGYYPTWYYLQLLYYYAAMAALLLGLSWLTASLAVFTKDVVSIVGMMLQFGFWLTPIFWTFDIVPAQFQLLLKLNPLYYIVEGYRDTLLHDRGFWESPALTLYYWAVTGSILLAGRYVYKKLRPHFADVL